jgi:hypothetical protein
MPMMPIPRRWWNLLVRSAKSESQIEMTKRNLERTLKTLDKRKTS